MAKRRIDRLIFVFSADSGTLNAFLDSAKKLLRIKGCTLCAITHGLAGEKSEWRDCKEELGVPIDYVHRDEVSGDLQRIVGDKLPCVVAQTGDDLVLVLGPDVLERCQGSVADLKGRLQTLSAMKGLELPQPVPV
jgi:hypothetical protein